jgi:hypothetical protein
MLPNTLELPMEDTRFQIGDRVRACASAAIRAGRFGTIILTFAGGDGMYDVQFDADMTPRLMQGRELERIADVPQKARFAPQGGEARYE